MEIGLYSFADLPLGPDGRGVDPAQVARRLENLLEEVEAADRAGLDVFGVGEHHRADYAVSTPAVVLAAAAARTRRIRLTSAVTVLSSDDPVRVHQEFSTVDLISGGRAEIMAGRGSFIESFPLFGYDLEDYDSLFAEKLDLLLKLRRNGPIRWSGKHRPALDDVTVHPRPLQPELPIWIAVGGTPASAARAGRLGLPLALAIIGGYPQRFAPLVQLYRDAARSAGHDPDALPVSINSHGWIAESTDRARDEFYPYYEAVMARIGRERGWPPPSRAQFDALCEPEGALLVGTPEEVADKIVFEWGIFRHDRMLLQLGIGGMPHDRMLHAIELVGSRVAPRVRAALARR